jgi:trehalose synthase
VRCHLQRLALGRRTAADYEPIVGAEAIERLREAAAPLRGARSAHLIAAGSRLRSTDLLPSLLSLYGDLGLSTELHALAGDRPLWRLVRQLEDGLQGGETAITDEAWDDYLDSMPPLEGFDLIVIHGPGPIAAAPGATCIWRPELDHSNPDPDTWQRLSPLAEPRDLPEAIDPLAPGSVDLPVRLAGSMLRSAGVDLANPCCCQIRPFDSWQDPHEVLDAFELARQQVPNLQLVMAGDPSRGDIEAWRLLREVSDYADTRDGVLLLTGPVGLGNTELNALRTISRAALESAIGPAPATTALETLWKGTPVVSEGSVGAAHPVQDGVNGYVTDSPEQTAARLAELVRDPGLGIELGAAGRELVRDRHLITQLAENELRLLASFQSA